MRWILAFVLLAACGSAQEGKLETGMWKGLLELPGGTLPFAFELNHSEYDGYTVVLHNAEERILLENIRVTEDSVIINFPVYDGQILSKIHEDRTNISGAWHFYSKGPDYIVPFAASRALVMDETDELPELKKVGGKWEVQFFKDGDTSQAIGVFDQVGDQVTGTFLVNTGDYRYLEGFVDGDQLQLSCFDGSHAFLFKAKLREDGQLSGEFWSGTHWYENWQGVRNDSAVLNDPYTLTYLKEGYDKLSFSFPDLDSNLVSLDQDRFRGKPLVIQILGSWCPNCIDETKFLTDYYKQNYKGDFEFIGLSYERTDQFREAVRDVQRLVDHFQIEYPILIAGKADRRTAPQTLPMLNNILSYPTTIFVDKQGRVRRIHTGFSGPATGTEYEKFKRAFDNFLKELVAERDVSA